MRRSESNQTNQRANSKFCFKTEKMQPKRVCYSNKSTALSVYRLNEFLNGLRYFVKVKNA